MVPWSVFDTPCLVQCRTMRYILRLDHPLSLVTYPYIANCLCRTSTPSLNHFFPPARPGGNCRPNPNAINTVLLIAHAARDFSGRKKRKFTIKLTRKVLRPWRHTGGRTITLKPFWQCILLHSMFFTSNIEEFVQ